MLNSKFLDTSQVADVACCSTRSIKAIRSNLGHFGQTRAPYNGGRRPRSITPPMIEALCEHPLEKPDLYLNETVVFLWDEFQTLVTISSVSTALALIGGSKKVARQVAKQQSC